MIKKYVGAWVVMACVIATGCTTYGKGSGQVDVSDSNENKSLNLLQQVNSLEAENTGLKNQVEVLQHELEQVNRRVNTQQTELDRLYQEEGLGGYTYNDPALQAQPPVAGQLPVLTPPVPVGNTSQPGLEAVNAGGVEQSVPAPLPGTAPTTQPTATMASSASAQELYNSGFEQLKQGQYDQSIQTFSTLLVQYPTSTFADDAQYWTGEAYYVNREFSNAQQAFNRVVTAYPDSDRAPDALLKIGYIYYEQGDTANARRIFNEIIAKYPNERVSDFAKSRLANLGG